MARTRDPDRLIFQGASTQEYSIGAWIHFRSAFLCRKRTGCFLWCALGASRGIHFAHSVLPEGFTLRTLVSGDIACAIEIDCRAEAAEVTARRQYTDSENGLSRLQEDYLQTCEDQSGVLLFANDQPIGVASVLFSGPPRNNPTFQHVPTFTGLSLLPLYWGKGISKYLYSEILKVIARSGHRHFVAHSRTKQVLAGATKAGLLPYQVSLLSTPR